MGGVTEQRRLKQVRSAPRRKSAELSPELNEVLKMLKALEDQPESVLSGPDDPAG